MIEQIFNKLSKSGSNISGEDISDIKSEIEKYRRKDYGLNEVINNIALDIKDITEEFLNKKNKFGVDYISGISSCIYLPAFDNSKEIKITLVGGNRSRNSNIKVDFDTLFDVASITKLYTLILAFEFERLGLINLNDKIASLNSDFKGLDDFTFNDLIRLCGVLKTNGNITVAKTEKEAFEILKTLTLTDKSKDKNTYTDFGAIAIGKTLLKVVNETYKLNLSYEELFAMFITEPLKLNSTMYNPLSHGISNISGNNGNGVHDRKAKILGGALGSAGIFTTSSDLARLAKSIYSVNYMNSKFLNKEYVERFGEITFKNLPTSNKGNLGIYVKHPQGFDKTYTPSEFSNGSFSHQGWTGAVATFDPNNLIHQNILVNAIYEDVDKDKIKNDKPVGFSSAFDIYLKELTKQTMLSYVAKKYYNLYCNQKEEINIEKTVK